MKTAESIMTAREISFVPRQLKRLAMALLFCALSQVLPVRADPLLTSWYMTNSAQYARVYTNTTARNNGITATTWTNQPSPVYSDIQTVLSSSSYVYVEYAGLASYVMGPWTNPTGGTFTFWPTNQIGIRRFPRSPVVQSGSKDSTSGGYSGLFVNGVAIFNALDGQAWSGSAIVGQAAHTSSTYYWHRNAPVAESYNFDPGMGHQPPSAVYHTHQNPLALRYQLGDHVSYSSSTHLYSASSGNPTAHSPIIGWAHDGYPVYGPYGYSVTNDSSSGIRRMVSGYQKRDGSNGADSVASNLSTIPAWYARYRLAHFGGTYSTTAGTSRASVNTTYPLGTFAEDWAYLGDCGKTQGTDFDLDEYNGRYCVTPEYPNGTYAYFTTIDSSGDSTYPYIFAYEFYGDASGGSVSSISETVSTNYIGGPNTLISINTPAVTNTTVTLVWSSVEGGTYKVETSTDQSNWTTKASGLVASGITTTTNFTGSNGTGYARVSRTSLATYNSAAGTRNSTQTNTASYTVDALSISTQPVSQTVNLSSSASFSVVAGGISPFSYQWRKNGISISGATASSYTIGTVMVNDAASYSVIVTNTAGSVTSSTAVLNINGAPSISTPPASQSVNMGTSAIFSLVVSGTSPFSYQWRKNASAISGATASSYTIGSAQASDAASYSVIVTNVAGSVTSADATLTLNVAPTISTQPASQTINAGSAVIFSAIASGTSPLSYQWNKNSAAISGATASSYTIASVTTNDVGTFSIIVTNVAGSVTSQNAVLTVTTYDDPRTNSWYTTYSGKYARIYTNDSMKTAGTSLTTWNNGSQNQSAPAYCGVQEVYSSSSWVYIRSTGLGSHIMGPWYLNSAHTQIFPSLPTNQKALYRIPRNPSVPSTKTSSSGGVIGYFVDGIAMFNGWDAYYWTGTTEANNNGTGYWNRDAYVNESVSFDPAYAHQAGGQHHYHADPIALRYLLGDNILFDSTTKTYSENTNNTSLKHSPILGWVADGYPIYGPYGYSSATDTNSGIRRMTTGYQLRNGSNGTDNLSTTGRSSIPLWAVRLYNVSSNQTGPTVSTTYPLGRYMEDNAYLGDCGKTQGTDFDLDEYNGRFCKTPEFPNGTYAYFISIETNGTPKFPYCIGRGYYGSPTGSSWTNIAETVSTNFLGGPNKSLNINTASVAQTTVTLAWSSVEGGTYKVESSPDQSAWTTKINSLSSQGISTQTNYTGTAGTEYGRVTRTALASYDPANTNVTATVSQTAIKSYVVPSISITTQPQSQSAYIGDSVAFNVVAGGTGPFGYQWRKNGSAISGATDSGYTIGSVTANAAASYSVIVTNAAGSLTSSTAVLTLLNHTPTLTTINTFSGAVEDTPFTISYSDLLAASDAYDAEGNTLSFIVENVSNGTLKKDGTAVVAGITTLSSGENLVWTDSTNSCGSSHWAFTVKVTDGNSTSASDVQVIANVACLNDTPTLGISGNLSGTEDTPLTISYSYLTTVAGTFDADEDAISFRIENVSSGTLTKNGSAVVGGNTLLSAGESLVWTPEKNAFGLINAFTVKAFDGTTTSTTSGQIAVSVAAVADQPTLTTISTLTGATKDTAFYIAYATLLAASDASDVDGGTLSFFVENLSSGTLIKNGTNVFVGSTALSSGESLVWTPATGVTGSSVPAFAVKLSNGNLLSADLVQVKVNVEQIGSVPSITAPPQSQSVLQGSNVTFSVVAEGEGVLGYQWTFNSAEIAGATQSVYSRANIQSADLGSYSVIVSNEVGSVTSSSAALSMIADTEWPVLTVVSPKANTAYVSSALTVNGTAKDNTRVTAVEYNFNGSGYGEASLSRGAAVSNWTANIELVAGTNTLSVRAKDMAANYSKTNSLTFFWNATNQFGLVKSGPGQITATSSSIGNPTNGAPLLVGRSYKLTMTADANCLLSNVTYTAANGESGSFFTNTSVASGYSLAFTMKSNMTITANFITNPLVRFAGNYYGLFHESDSVRHHSAGYASIKVSSKFGASGKLSIDGNSLGFSGKMKIDGTMTTTVSRSAVGKPDLTLTLAMNYSGANETLSGTISGTSLEGESFDSDLEASRAVWTDTELPLHYTNRYTMIVTGFMSNVQGPAGYGFATIDLTSTKGTIKLSGELSDSYGGSVKLSQSTLVSKDGAWPLYAPIYNDSRSFNDGSEVTTLLETKGELFGWLYFQQNTNAGTTNLAPLGKLDWIKTGGTNSSWALGFTNQVEANSSRHLPPASGSTTRMYNFNNASVVLSGGLLSGGVTNTVNLKTDYTFYVDSSTARKKFKASLVSKTGLIKGSFTNSPSGSSSIPWTGVMLQDLNYGLGFFMDIPPTTNSSGKVKLTPLN